MLNRRGTLWVIFGIFFVLSFSSMTLGQTSLSDSEIIKEINASERRTRAHVDAKFEGVNTKFSDIDTKIGNLNTNVAVNTTNIANMSRDISELKGTVTWIWRGILGIFGTLIISVVGYFGRLWWQNRFNRAGESLTNPKTFEPHLPRESQLWLTDDTHPDYQHIRELA